MTRLGTLARRAARSSVLATFTTPYSVGRWLELLNPLWSDEDRARVVNVEPESADVVTVTLRPAPGWPGHEAGQHTVLRGEVDGRRIARAFTLAGSEHDRDTVTLTCKAYEGAVLVPWLRDQLRPGDVVGLDHPTGDVRLPSPRPAHLVCVVGGSGITPAMAMLRTLRDERHTGRITFVQFARTRTAALFTSELAAAELAMPGLRVHTVTTREDDGPLSGRRLDVGLLDELAPGWRDATSLVCGPVRMLEAAEALWAGAGARERLLIERFRPPSIVVPPDGERGAITFAGSGTTVADDGRSLLEQAEAAGLSPASGCRMGICHTCDRPKLAGLTRDVRDGALDAGERSRIQPCVSVAVGDVELDL